MARPLRIEFPGAVYHVTSRGDRREAIYRDDDDRRAHLDVLALSLARFDAQVLAYCLMGNHYHLVLHTRSGQLSRLMRHFNGVYTQRFNRRHGLVGHLFQGRFKAILVDHDAYLLALCRYVERNPVAAGIVSTIADWPWSSYPAHAGAVPAPVWLDSTALHTQLLGHAPQSAADHQRAAAQYVDRAAAAAATPLWQSGLRQQIYLGDEAFIARMLDKAGLASAAALREVPKAQRTTGQPLASYFATPPDRAAAMHTACTQGGFSMTEIAAHVGLSVSRVSRLIARCEAKGKT